MLLSGCILLVSALLHRTTQYQRRSEILLESAAFADQTLSEVRGWAAVPANYDSNWDAWRGRVVTSSEFPGLSARVDVQAPGPTVLSPDHYTEVVLPDPRPIHRAVVAVRVQAGRDLTSPLGRIETWTHIASPSPRVPGLDVRVTSADSGPLVFNGTRSFRAEAFDGNGRPLPQCCFEWRIRQISGNASGGASSRDGRQFVLRHDRTRWDEDALPVPADVPASGEIDVIAQARIMGETVTGAERVVLVDL